MIDINEIGATAFVIASIRAMEKEQPDPLFSDPYAEWFSNERALGAARQLNEAFPPSTTMVRYRTRYFNDFIERGIAAGARQVVLMGGGFDMRGHLYGNPDVAFFEVDQKAVLEFKRFMLGRHGIEQLPSVPGNYLEVDVGAGLADIGFDAEAPTLIVWEGNTMYLPPELIMPFLNRLASAIETFRIPHRLRLLRRLDLQNRSKSSSKLTTTAEGSKAWSGRWAPRSRPGSPTWR